MHKNHRLLSSACSNYRSKQPDILITELGNDGDRQTDLFLSLSERKVLQLVDAEAGSFGELHQVSGRVRAGTEDEDDRRQRRALLEHRLVADDRRHDILDAHDARHELGDRAVDAVDAEAA